MTQPLFRRLALFCVTGASGVGVNMGLLILLTEVFRLPYFLSSLVAIEVSILSNFALNNAWTWRDRRTSPLPHRLLKYHAAAGVTALLANWSLLVILTHFAGLDYRLSNLIGIAVGVLLNFYLNHLWTFGDASPAADSPERPGSKIDVRPEAVNNPPALSERRLTWLVIGCAVFFTAAKVYFASHAELLSEEAYYWSYLQHPALGYFDHPAMVAWVIGLGTFLLGDTELGVRLGTILLSLGSTWLVFLLTRLWFDRRRACFAALLFNIIPIFLGVGLLAFPDGPLVFFWLLTLYAVSKALGIGDPSAAAGANPGVRSNLFWLLGGVAFGAALLSKYTAVLLGASLGLFLLLSPNHRHWLRRPQPWLAALVALLVFSPVIFWNASHGWASFVFQSTRAAGQRNHVWKSVIEFWLLQLLILGPLFLVFGAAMWRGLKRGWLERDDRWNYAASFCLPLFAVFVLASFKTEVHINWTTPCFLSLLPVVAALFCDGLENRLRVPARGWRWLGIASGGFAVGVAVLAGSVMLYGFPTALISSRSGGWRELAAQVTAAEADLARASGEKPFVIGADRYNISAELGFYSHSPRDQINNLALGKHGLGFRYWTDLNGFEGRPALTVAPRLDELTMAELRQHFNRIGPARPLVVKTLGPRTRTVWLIDCYGYRAGARLSGHAAALSQTH